MGNYKTSRGSISGESATSSDQATITTIVDITALTLTLPSTQQKVLVTFNITHANTTLGANDVFSMYDNGSLVDQPIITHQDVATYYINTTCSFITVANGQIVKLRGNVVAGSMTVYGGTYRSSISYIGT